MKTRFFHHTLFLVSLLLLTACSTGSQRTEIDQHSTDISSDFSQLKTYRWDFAAMGKTVPEGGHFGEFDRVLCEHVDKHLAEMGYQRVAKGNTDFVLDYRVVVTQQEAAEASATGVDNNQQANQYGLRWTFDKDQSPTYQGLQAPKDNMVVYRNGTLHLGAFDNQGRSLWHTSASRILGERANEAERRAALRIAVNKLMQEFPRH